nr:Gfo/Idh/MocA family oxidoreductase [bacterium]
MEKVRLAILGQGRSGRDIHGAYIRTMPELYQVVAVVDPLEDRRNRALEEYPGCEVFAHHSELYGRKDIDFVVNATPSHFHVPVTMDLLSHGFNVLCEKPFARYPYEVDAMIREAKKNNVVLAVFQQSRFAGYFQQLQKVLASGVLGRIVQISTRANGYARRWDWQTVQDYNAGSLLNTGPHAMDQVLALLGFPEDPMPQVFSVMDRANTFGDAEDFVKVILKTPGKPLVDYEISACDAYTGYTYLVQGTQGTFTCTNTEAKWRYFKPEEAPRQQLVRTPLMTADGLPCYCREQLTWYEDSWTATPEEADIFHTATHQLYQTVIAAVKEGKPLVVTPEQVRLQIAIMAECHEQSPLSRLV